jgi:hypothetical protein
MTNAQIVARLKKPLSVEQMKLAIKYLTAKYALKASPYLLESDSDTFDKRCKQNRLAEKRFLTSLEAEERAGEIKSKTPEGEA